MGRTGFGVGFADAGSPAPLSPYAQLLEALGNSIDDVSVASLKLAMAQVEELRTIEATRTLALDLALKLPGSDSRHSREELAERSVVAQLAAALHVSELAARNRMWTARCLINDLPATLQSLADGAITLRHAQLLVDEVGTLDPESLRMLEEEALRSAGHTTPPQFKRLVRTLSERLNLEDIVERHIAAAEERTAYAEPMRNGMGRYVIEAPIVQIIAVDNFITDIARARQNEGETRTLMQLKADAATDLLLNIDSTDENGVWHGTTAGLGNSPVDRIRTVRPKVLVTVPAMTLLRRGPDAATEGANAASNGAGPASGGADGTSPEALETEQPEEPGILEGYGPIDPQTARDLVANAKCMTRILTHPETGVALSIGRTRYRIPKAMRAWLRFRDGVCRFPGCNRPAMRCELDHNEEWARDGGDTAHCNLCHLCPGHHTLKTLKGWTPLQDPSGTGEIMWLSPTGHVHFTEPEQQVRPVGPSRA